MLDTEIATDLVCGLHVMAVIIESPGETLDQTQRSHRGHTEDHSGPATNLFTLWVHHEQKTEALQLLTQTDTFRLECCITGALVEEVG